MRVFASASVFPAGAAGVTFPAEEPRNYAADASVFFRPARSSYRSGDAPVTAASLDSGLSGSAYSLLDEEEEANEVDSAIFQVPRL